MESGRNQRSTRNVPNSDEIARRINRLAERRQRRIVQFKRSRLFLVFNSLIVICYCIHWELLLSYAGPCIYSEEMPPLIEVKYGADRDSSGKYLLKELSLVMKDGYVNKIQVYDFVPEKIIQPKIILVGKDLFLHKWLKVKVSGLGKEYRLKSAEPVIFLCGFLILVTSIGFFFNLNEHPVTLSSLAIFNVSAVLAFLLI